MARFHMNPNIRGSICGAMSEKESQNDWFCSWTHRFPAIKKYQFATSALALLVAKQRRVCLSLGVGLEAWEACLFLVEEPRAAGPEELRESVNYQPHIGTEEAALPSQPRPPFPLPPPGPHLPLLRAGGGHSGGGGAMSQHSTLLHLLAGG